MAQPATSFFRRSYYKPLMPSIADEAALVRGDYCLSIRFKHMLYVASRCFLPLEVRHNSEQIKKIRSEAKYEGLQY